MEQGPFIKALSLAELLELLAGNGGCVACAEAEKREKVALVCCLPPPLVAIERLMTETQHLHLQYALELLHNVFAILSSAKKDSTDTEIVAFNKTLLAALHPYAEARDAAVRALEQDSRRDQLTEWPEAISALKGLQDSHCKTCPHLTHNGFSALMHFLTS